LLPAGQFYIQKPVCIVWVTSIYVKKAFDALVKLRLIVVEEED